MSMKFNKDISKIINIYRMYLQIVCRKIKINLKISKKLRIKLLADRYNFRKFNLVKNHRKS